MSRDLNEGGMKKMTVFEIEVAEAEPKKTGDCESGW